MIDDVDLYIYIECGLKNGWRMGMVIRPMRPLPFHILTLSVEVSLWTIEHRVVAYDRYVKSGKVGH